MSEYCNNRLSERFKNKIPQFLTHLNVWNEYTMHDCAARCSRKVNIRKHAPHAVDHAAVN